MSLNESIVEDAMNRVKIEIGSVKTCSEWEGPYRSEVRLSRMPIQGRKPLSRFMPSPPAPFIFARLI